MASFDGNGLQGIKRFDQLVKYLRDELDWPIDNESFDDLTFDYDAEELGIDMKTAAKIQQIKQLRPLVSSQPWGIFFVKFEPKRLPVVALRRLLSQLVIKRRANSRKAEQPAWHLHDLLFISNYGEGEQRQITFAHFSQDESKDDLPTLRVLGWDNLDTPLHLDHVADILTERLTWPDDETDVKRWRESWSSAFTLRHREVINTSQDLAVRLAELARAIRDRIRTVLAMETKNGPITKLMDAFQKALIHDLDADGFGDMYAQTIAYGLLTARITNPKANTADGFAMQLPVTNPFLKEMMETFLLVGGRKGRAGQVPGIDFDELGVSEVVELLDDANMEAVIRDFGDRNPQEDPVIHFYELFLKEYDAKKRIQRGAFYTPKPVVSYIIRSVHELLQAEFGLEDGLASTVTWGEMARKHSDIKIPSGTSPDSPFIMILDIATGTGTFLVEAIDVILKTMTAKWQKQGKREQEITKLWNEYVPKHLLPRLYGYELMMAPYAIAHMKIGLKLFETGYQFKSDERVRVYLTNTLEPASDAQQKLVGILPALAHEAEAVNEIKRTVRFTAVVGNPPYSGHSVNNGDWINHLLRTQLKDGADSYFRVDGQDIGERNPKWLNDDYVKFVRYGQNRIAESESGILAFITNHGYLDNPTFRGMRQSLMASFPKMFLLNLHGNAKKKEAAPDGSKDENVFDIQQGVSIGIFTIGIRKSLESSVYHADLWGNRQTKYKRMYEYPLSPQICNRLYPDKPYYLFSPQNIDLRSEYLQGFMLSDIFPVNGVGMTTARDHMVIDFEEELLMSRAKMFRDSTLSNLDLCKVLNIPEKKGWNINKARKNIQQENDLKIYIKPVLYRPFDERLIFYHDSLVWRTVKQIMIHMLTGNNVSLSFHRREELDIPYSHFFVTRRITEHGLLSSKTTNSQAPLYLYPDTSKQKSFVAAHVWPIDKHGRVPNLSPDFVKAIEETIRLRFDPSSDGGNSIFTPEDIFHYIYAILYSQTYRSRYVEFLKIDFPRIPITTDQDLFRRLCLLGAELVDLHLLESPKINNFITTFHENGDCQITKVGDKGKTISHVSNGKGRLYINATAYFDGIPVNVWDFHIGGYRVCHKWLDERRKAGRSLYNDDISHYQKIVVALAETIRLMKEIDEVIEEHGGWPGAFVTDKQELP